MAASLSLLLNSSGLIILLPSIRMGCLMFCFKSSGLGFFFVVEGGRGSTTTNDLPEGLPSAEEILKVLTRVLKALDDPGLKMSEIQRLQAMVATIRTYKEMLADYVQYRNIEKKLVEMEAKYARIVKEKA